MRTMRSFSSELGTFNHRFGKMCQNTSSNYRETSIALVFSSCLSILVTIHPCITAHRRSLRRLTYHCCHLHTRRTVWITGYSRITLLIQDIADVSAHIRLITSRKEADIKFLLGEQGHTRQLALELTFEGKSTP